MNKKVLFAFFLAFMACVPLRAEESDIRMADGATFTVGDYEYIFNPNGATLRSVDILRHLDLTAAEIDVPATVEYGSVEFNIHGIREGAFSSHFNLEKVNIAEGIINLMPCFADCPKLHSLRLPESIGGIPDYFLKGTSIKELHIADLKDVGEYAFSNDCLETLQIDKCTQTVLRDYSFARTNLEEIVVPENIEYITDYVFAYNKNLRKIKFGSKIKKIGEMIFYQCTRLVTMELAAPTPPELIYRYVFTGGRDNYDWICETFHDVSGGGSQYWDPWFIVVPEKSIPIYKSVNPGKPYGYWRIGRYYAIGGEEPQEPELKLEISPTSINPEIGSSFVVTAGIPGFCAHYLFEDYGYGLYDYTWEITDKSVVQFKYDYEPTTSWSSPYDDLKNYLVGKKANLIAVGEGECDIIIRMRLFPKFKEVCHVSTRPSGVDGMEQDEVRQDVYNLQGVRVKSAATKDDIDALPAGIYIIGGKKIVKTN